MALVRHLMNEREREIERASSEVKAKHETTRASLNAQKAVHSFQKINYENEIVSIN